VQQLVKGMSRTVPVENFPRPIVEHRLHARDLASRDAIELGAGGKELPQQSVRILVRAPLPGTLRMGKVDLHLRLLREESMFAHVLALVIREGAAGLGGQRPHFTGEGPPHGGRVFSRQRYQQRKSGGALDQRPQRRRVGMADEQVPLPMARHRAIHDLGRPFVDTNDVLDRARGAAELAGTTKTVAPSQIPGQLALERAARQHIQIGVDGFVRNTHRRVLRIPLEQPVGNLFGQPTLGEQRQHGAAELEMDRELAELARMVGPALGSLMGRHGAERVHATTCSALAAAPVPQHEDYTQWPTCD
jgi:hypothetical protein